MTVLAIYLARILTFRCVTRRQNISGQLISSLQAMRSNGEKPPRFSGHDSNFHTQNALERILVFLLVVMLLDQQRLIMFLAYSLFSLFFAKDQHFLSLLGKHNTQNDAQFINEGSKLSQ